MKLLVDIPNNLNKNLKLEKISRDINSLPELIIKILEERYKDE